MVLVVCVVLLFAALGLGKPLDVHLVPSDEVAQDASGLASLAPHNAVSFASAAPHVTLYLTDFVDGTEASVVAAARTALLNATVNCEVKLRGLSWGGGYALWEVALSPCLQAASDAVVNACWRYAKANQPIPVWVLQLPQKEREAKIAMIRKYGSPNVFSQFEPHVTVAFDQDDDLARVYGNVSAEASFEARVAAVSGTGPYGTVLRNATLATIPIGRPEEHHVRASRQHSGCKPSRTNAWDYFLFVREWPGTMTPGPVPKYVDTFTLHGLWPNRNDGTWPQCCNGSYPFRFKQIEPIYAVRRRDASCICVSLLLL